MKTDLVYWEDEIGKTPKKISVDVSPYGIELGTRAEWQMGIAAEDKKVEANVLIPIKIQPVEVPEGAIVLPCIFMRHALGIVTGITCSGRCKPVEEERTISEVLFHPIESGVIYKNELLTVINIIPAAIEEELPSKEAVYRWMQKRYEE